MEETIIILANSRKFSGRCIAGKTLDGRWVRLVQDGKRSIPEDEGNEIEILGKYEIDLVGNRFSENLCYHTENYTYENLKFTGIASINELYQYLDNPEYIYNDTKRFIKFPEAKNFANSLTFVKVSDLLMFLSPSGGVRCNFVYNGIEYLEFCLTDSKIEREFRSRNCTYPMCYRDAYITVSIGVPSYLNVFKLVSGVIQCN